MCRGTGVREDEDREGNGMRARLIRKDHNAMGGEGTDEEVDHPQEGAVPREERDRESRKVHGEGAKGERGELAEDVVDGGCRSPLDGTPEMREASQRCGGVWAVELLPELTDADETAEHQSARHFGEVALVHLQVFEKAVTELAQPKPDDWCRPMTARDCRVYAVAKADHCSAAAVASVSARGECR